MRFYFGKTESVLGVVGQHAVHQVFENVTEEAGSLCSAMHHSEMVIGVRIGENSVELVRLDGFGEGWVLGLEDEENHCHCEHVDLSAAVAFVLMDLGSHISFST